VQISHTNFTFSCPPEIVSCGSRISCLLTERKKSNLKVNSVLQRLRLRTLSDLVKLFVVIIVQGKYNLVLQILALS